jgi:hypothetical protein
MASPNGGSLRARLKTFLVDVRTERSVRMSLVLAACLAVFYFFTVPSTFRNGAFGVSSLLYWGPLLGVSGMPVVMQYSTGAFWQFGLLQLLALPIVLVMMTTTLVTMQMSIAGGYAVLCTLYIFILGPLYCSSHPGLHAIGMICSIFLGERGRGGDLHACCMSAVTPLTSKQNKQRAQALPTSTAHYTPKPCSCSDALMSSALSANQGRGGGSGRGTHTHAHTSTPTHACTQRMQSTSTCP